MLAAAMIDTFLAQEKASGGDFDGAIELSRTALEQQFAFGDKISISWATAVLVEALLSRRDGIDLHEAQVAIDRLEAVPTEPGSVRTTSGCCGCARCSRGRTVTMPPTATIGIATAPWRHRLASRGTWIGPRRCHDGGRGSDAPVSK